MRTFPSLLQGRLQRPMAGLLALLVGATAAVVPAAAASAGPIPGADLSRSEKMRRWTEMRLNKASDAAIANELGLIKVSTEDRKVTPLSVNTDVVVSTPTVAWDPNFQEYIAATDYQWKNRATVGDGAPTGGRVGGNDAFAIRFSRQVEQTYTPQIEVFAGNWSGATPYPTYYRDSIRPGLWDNSEEGVAGQWQDAVHATNCSGSDYPSCRYYDSAIATIFFYFRPIGSGCTQIFSQHAHTWSSTGINSIAVSTSGFEVNFSSSSNRWQLTSGAGKLGC